MKSLSIFVLLLPFILGACTSVKPIAQNDDYDDVYFTASEKYSYKNDNTKNYRESDGLPAESYDTEYNHRPMDSYSNPDAVVYEEEKPDNTIFSPVEQNNNNNNWNNYNSWQNCWNCGSNWGGGGFYNPYSYYNPYNTWSYWGRPYGYGWNVAVPITNGFYIGYSSGWNNWWGNPYYNNYYSPYYNYGYGSPYYNDNFYRKVQVAPRVSAGRGSTAIRNNPNPRIESNPDYSSTNRTINTSGGRTRNASTNTYTPTQSNQTRTTGRVKNTEREPNNNRYSSNSSKTYGVDNNKKVESNSRPSRTYSSGNGSSDKSSSSSGSRGSSSGRSSSSGSGGGRGRSPR
ncbi:MAG: hypothetical protein SFU27_12735 [Thermonemataceae bacterium]|nr:hypothetical protein [Thermonemataceae bacterium]